jgi:hypothetical protein
MISKQTLIDIDLFRGGTLSHHIQLNLCLYHLNVCIVVYIMARRLVVPSTRRSEVWNYFGFEADESGIILNNRRYVWCRLCDSQLPFSGNTTNLSAHIARCRKTLRVLGEQSQPAPVTGSTQNTSFSEEIPSQNEDRKQVCRV